MAEFELRKLRGDDVFPMLKIVKKIGIREFGTIVDNKAVVDAVKNYYKGGSADLITVGLPAVIDMAAIVIENLPCAENEIISFCSGLSGMSEQEIREGDFSLLPEMIVAVFQKEEFRDFFTAVTGSLKREK